MNGEHVIQPLAAMVNPCVGLLENMLADAKAGRVTSVAVISILSGGQVASGYAGAQRGDLFLGAALLQDSLLTSIKGPPTRPAIIPARMGG